MPIKPDSISLRDIPPSSGGNIFTGLGEIFGLKSPQYNLSNKGDQLQLKAIQDGIMSGQYNDAEIQEFAKLYPEATPLISQALRQREVLKQNFQPQKAPVTEIDPTGTERLVAPGQTAKADLGGAIAGFAGQGDIETAKNYASLAGKGGAEKNITSIQLGLRAEGQMTGDPRIDRLDPKTAANVLARTTSPVAVQTIGGTALYGRGGVPGGTLPTFLPEAPTAEEARTSARGEVAGDNLTKFESLLNSKKFTPGPVSGRALRLSGLTGVKLSNEEAQALSLEQGLGNDLLQAMRGAQVGPKEQEMFEKQLPRVTQPEPLFRANLERTRETLKKLNTLVEQKRRGTQPNQKSRTQQLNELMGF